MVAGNGLSRIGGHLYVNSLSRIGVACVVCCRACGVLFEWDVPIDAPELFGLFYPSHFLPPCRAGIAPCSMGTFAHRTTGDESFHSLLFTVFCLVLLRTILASLGPVVLYQD